jgi:hypothetical protein
VAMRELNVDRLYCETWEEGLALLPLLHDRWCVARRQGSPPRDVPFASGAFGT